MLLRNAQHSMTIEDLQATALSINYNGNYLLLAGEDLIINYQNYFLIPRRSSSSRPPKPRQLLGKAEIVPQKQQIRSFLCWIRDSQSLVNLLCNRNEPAHRSPQMVRDRSNSWALAAGTHTSRHRHWLAFKTSLHARNLLHRHLHTSLGPPRSKKADPVIVCGMHEWSNTSWLQQSQREFDCNSTRRWLENLGHSKRLATRPVHHRSPKSHSWH